MAKFELFEMEGGAGPVALGIGALLLVPSLLPVIRRALRPLAKGAIKTGISIYDEARGTFSEAYEAAGDLVLEARAELKDQAEAGGPAADEHISNSHRSGEEHHVARQAHQATH